MFDIWLHFCHIKTSFIHILCFIVLYLSEQEVITYLTEQLICLVWDICSLGLTDPFATGLAHMRYRLGRPRDPRPEMESRQLWSWRQVVGGGKGRLGLAAQSSVYLFFKYLWVASHTPGTGLVDHGM